MWKRGRFKYIMLRTRISYQTVSHDEERYQPKTSQFPNEKLDDTNPCQVRINGRAYYFLKSKNEYLIAVICTLLRFIQQQPPFIVRALYDIMKTFWQCYFSNEHFGAVLFKKCLLFRMSKKEIISFDVALEAFGVTQG